MVCLYSFNEYSWLYWIDKYHLACKNCRWPNFAWHGYPYLMHPDSGWWEEASAYPYCDCRFYDDKGSKLDQHTGNSIQSRAPKSLVCAPPP